MSHSERLTNLANHLLSPAVQVPLPKAVPDEPERLTSEEVRHVFVNLVPGVERFLFRDTPGQYSLNFIVTTYASGLRDYNRTPLGKHLLSLFRVIVHHGHDSPNNSSTCRYVQDLAAAFQDCQAVQARTIESLGLQILGITTNFRGLVERLIGDYKKMAIMMRAMEKVQLGEMHAGGIPTHVENRLIADLGDALGLDQESVRLANLDIHANSRHARFGIAEINREVARCRQLFEVEVVLQAFVAEVNKFSADSPPESLPALFVKWADANMNPNHKHVIFDAETCSRIEVNQPLALAILETLFLGSPRASNEEVYRDVLVTALFSERDDDKGDAPRIHAEADRMDLVESHSSRCSERIGCCLQ